MAASCGRGPDKAATDGANQPSAVLRAAYLAAVHAAAPRDYEVRDFRAYNAAHGFDVEFGARGPSVTAADASWRTDFTLAGYGCPGALQPVEPAAREAARNRLDYRRGPALTEWYVNGPLGLEQGFTLAAPPACADLGGEVALELEVGGDLAPTPAAAGDEVHLRTAAGARALRYGDLYVRDAAGHELPARLALEGGRVTLTFAAAGAAYPVTVDPLIATQQAKLLASDGATGDYFGDSVSLSGDTAVVGAQHPNSQGGAAYVFVRSGNTWTQQAKLLASDGAPGDRFGYSVSATGDTAVVGAYAKNAATGAAYVFVRSANVWTQQAELIASDSAPGSGFGCSVSVSGDTAVIGAILAHGSALDTGAAYVFARNGSTWAQQAKLLPSDGALGDYFGDSVSVSGDVTVVGASEKNSATGAAYVFVRSGGAWIQQAKLVANDGAASDRFGHSVSLSRDTAVVGAYFKDSYSGAAYVFVQNGSSWGRQAKLLASDGAPNEYFGTSVSVSGDMAIVGATETSLRTGAAYVFARAGNTWTELAKLLASDGAAVDRFGSSVSVSGDSAVVGAGGKQSVAGSPWVGAAYAFLVRKATGDPCAIGIECTSGFCVDGTCCADACTTPCKSCANAAGTCTTNVAAGQADTNSTPACVASNSCDGAGVCKNADGQGCTSANECTSGFCVEGTCCGDACTATCKSCANAAGTCTSNVAQGVEDPDAFPACVGAYACDGAGGCRKANGQPCLTGGECVSTSCTDGVCCNEVCDGSCRYCQPAGHVGTCMAVPDGQDPRRECQASSGGSATCAGTCLGGQCAFPDVGRQCGLCSACDGTGRCTEIPADDDSCGVVECGGLDTACRAYRDLASSRCAALGVCKAANDPTNCTSYADLLCSDGGARPDGAPSPDAGVTPTGGKAGCGCVVGGQGRGAGWRALALTIAIATFRTRRRRIR